MQKQDSTRFEFCSLCNCLYTTKGRNQHLKTKKHRKQMEINNILSNSLITTEIYSLTLDGVVEVNED
jgi:hypothetical protein